MAQAVVFDLYNTLIHIPNYKYTHSRLYAAMGIKSARKIARAKKIAMENNFDSLDELAEFLKPRVKIDTAQFTSDIEDDVANAALYPETKRVLDELKSRKIRLGLISNLASPYKKPFFDLGLSEYFTHVIFSCDAGMKKPDKRIYKQMVSALGVKPIAALMVGDKLSNDVEAPRSVGMMAVHLERENTGEGSIRTLEGVLQYI